MRDRHLPLPLGEPCALVDRPASQGVGRPARKRQRSPDSRSACVRSWIGGGPGLQAGGRVNPSQRAQLVEHLDTRLWLVGLHARTSDQGRIEERGEVVSTRSGHTNHQSERSTLIDSDTPATRVISTRDSTHSQPAHSKPTATTLSYASRQVWAGVDDAVAPPRALPHRRLRRPWSTDDLALPRSTVTGDNEGATAT